MVSVTLSGANFNGNVDVTGTLGTSGTGGHFDVNTNKFTVNASTGNTTVAGTLDVDGTGNLLETLTSKHK